MKKFKDCFKTEAMEFTFYLLGLSGKDRIENLGIKLIHYESKEAAEQWYKIILSKIDVADNVYRSEAVEKLNYIYNDMIS